MPRTRRSIPVLVAVIAGFAVAGLTGLALAKSSPTLGAVHNATIGKTIAVDSHGLTVYELSPETTHHLLCSKANGCFKFWPPVTVSSANTKLSAATGIKGELGILHRNGVFQVTLAGRPLYRFAGDSSKRGQGQWAGTARLWRNLARRDGLHSATDDEHAGDHDEHADDNDDAVSGVLVLRAALVPRASPPGCRAHHRPGAARATG